MIIKPPIASCVRQLSPFLRYVVILIPLQNTKAGKKNSQDPFFRDRFSGCANFIGTQISQLPSQISCPFANCPRKMLHQLILPRQTGRPKTLV